MGEILEITKYVILAVSTILTILSLIYGKIKGKKSKNIDKAIDVTNELLAYITMAEDLKGYNGEDKKAVVTKEIKNTIKLKKLKISDEQISKLIDNTVFLTKNVNINKEVKKDGNATNN